MGIPILREGGVFACPDRFLNSLDFAPDSARDCGSVGSVAKFELDGTESNDVSIGEDHLFFDWRSADQRAVGAVEIFENGRPLDAIDSDARMAAGNVRII